MSLENIQLPAFVIHDLFKHSLIDLNSDEKSVPKPGDEKLHYLGNNEKHIAILISNSSSIFLADDQLTFLTGILSACKLTLADVALLNLYKTPAINFDVIDKAFTPQTILLFDVLPVAILLPFEVPHYQVQKFNGKQFLSVPSLDEIQKKQDQKKQLWFSLKQIFNK